MTFDKFNFHEQLSEGILSMGFVNATPIQQQAIPVIMDGDDVIACAQTGTGKTGAFLLPVLDHIAKEYTHHTTALILTPTRELAQQIDQQVEGIAYFTGISSLAVFGGGDGIVYEQQRRGIQNNVNIIIATPGRLIAHLTSGVLKLNQIKYLVLDEADRMLDMGFYDDIMRIVSYIPKKRQTLLFSATMPPKIRKMAGAILHKPKHINIAVSQPAEGIDQQVYLAADQQKIPLLKHILHTGSFNSIIIFSSTKEKVKQVYRDLKAAHFKVSAFHSDLGQNEREEILRHFKNKTLPIIIGTDALSRGIDVEGIDLVINYDVPPDPEDYVHRIGRTARAASKGVAITFVNNRDSSRFKSIEKLIENTITQKMLPEEIGNMSLPVTEAGEKNAKRKRPFYKKPRQRMNEKNNNKQG